MVENMPTETLTEPTTTTPTTTTPTPTTTQHLHINRTMMQHIHPSLPLCACKDFQAWVGLLPHCWCADRRCVWKTQDRSNGNRKVDSKEIGRLGNLLDRAGALALEGKALLAERYGDEEKGEETRRRRNGGCRMWKKKKWRERRRSEEK
eukprot:GHVS01087951.1.p1 GENE.GHVS01087951.1~~GHVS01087951.1.p1  ORF type:complete len:149 (+),score=32.02 GHVS01087951.1:532-978(+)